MCGAEGSRVAEEAKRDDQKNEVCKASVESSDTMQRTTQTVQYCNNCL